jgi:hypothetical protein
MAVRLRDVCCARLPADALRVLADLRATTGITVALDGESAWVRWESSDDQVLCRLWPVAGVELYVFQGGRWHRFGRHLPALDFPTHLEYRPLHQVLFPAPVLPVPPRTTPLQPLRLSLEPDQQPRPATALECSVGELARWAEMVSEVRLGMLQAAHCRGRVLLVGERLPATAAGKRFWGEWVLVPLGWRVEPELPASAVRKALGLDAEELLLLQRDRAEVVPRSAFAPLTRAQLRLASELSAR